jgi:hypothetical protein
VVPSVREIVPGLRRDLYSEYQIGVLRAFIDDSGSGGDSTWFVLAGYVGTVDGWDRFDGLWQAALHEHPHIEYFKAVQAERLKDEFDGFSKEQRDTKIDSLIDVISQCAERSICARLKQKDYDELVKGEINKKWDSPYYLLFSWLVGSTVATERRDLENRPVEFVFDSDERHDRRAYQLFTTMQNRAYFSDQLVNVLYRSERECLPLQAADLLAWQIRRWCCTDEKRKHFRDARYKLPIDPHVHVVTREQIRAMIEEMKDVVRRSALEHGISSDLKTWE